MNTTSAPLPPTGADPTIPPMARREPSADNGPLASTFEQQVANCRDERSPRATGDRAPAEKEHKDRGEAEGDVVGVSPKPIYESLALMQLDRLQGSLVDGAANKKGAGGAIANGDGTKSKPVSATGEAAFSIADLSSKPADNSQFGFAGAVAKATGAVSPLPRDELKDGNPMKRITLTSLATHLPAALTRLLSSDGSSQEEASARVGNASVGASSPSEILKDAQIAAGSGSGGATVEQPLQTFEFGMASTSLTLGSTPKSNFDVQGGAQTPASAAVSDAPDGRINGSPSKVLTFQLEPEELGAVTVRMQLTKTRVSVKIDVSNVTAQTALADSRDQLAQALSASGHAVEEIAIRVSPAPVPSDSHNESGQNGFLASGGQSGEGGSLGEGGSMARDRGGEILSRSQRKAEPDSEERASRDARSNGVSGVYI
jgi:flagellar hook-length control protein FliK